MLWLIEKRPRYQKVGSVSVNFRTLSDKKGEVRKNPFQIDKLINQFIQLNYVFKNNYFINILYNQSTTPHSHKYICTI